MVWRLALALFFAFFSGVVLAAEHVIQPGETLRYVSREDSSAALAYCRSVIRSGPGHCYYWDARDALVDLVAGTLSSDPADADRTTFVVILAYAMLWRASVDDVALPSPRPASP